MATTVPVPGSERKRPAESKYIEPLGDDEKIVVTLLIRSPADSPSVPDLDYWQNTPLTEQRFISSVDYVRTYGSSQTDLNKVVAFVEEHGLIVIDCHAGRGVVKVQGSAKQIRAAFGVTLHKYESPLPRRRASENDPKTHIHHSFAGDVQIPHDLSGIITAVIGLDNRAVGASAGTGDPPFTSAPLPSTVAGYYNFPNAGASDQVIGIPEFAPAGYLETDYTKYYFPSLPLGYDTIPSIKPISLVGAINEGPSQFNSGETMLDISVSGTIAQGATINVYFTDWSEAGWVDFLYRVLVPDPGEAQPTVVSISYIYYDDSSIGSLASSGSQVSIMHNILRRIAHQGINVFACSGDWGASDDAGSTPYVGYPSSDPWVTSCGATVIGNVHGSPPTFDEWAWSDMAGGLFYGATGGGSSAIFPIPPYQIAAGITTIEDSTGKIYTNRFVPDIAGMTAMSGFFLNSVPNAPWWGTSLVTPLYAGLTAVVRSALGIRLGPLNPILYSLRNVIFRDVTYGNNDPANGSAYFSAKPGYDACTGWGSIHGTKFLNAVAKLKFPRHLVFEVGEHTYTLEEVEHSPLYPTAFRLALEGFTPHAVGSHKPTLTGHFSALSNVKITVGPPTPEFPAKQFTPQRIHYTCSIDFTKPAIHTTAHGGVFPVLGHHPITESLGATITVLADTLVAHDAKFKLVSGPDWKEHENTGKVTGLIYDRFGYFEGFLLLNEQGKEKLFPGEKNAEELLRFAWEKRALISVLDKHHAHSPNGIILRRLPHP